MKSIYFYWQLLIIIIILVEQCWMNGLEEKKIDGKNDDKSQYVLVIVEIYILINDKTK